MKLLQQLLQWAERTLTARDYVQFVLLVIIGVAYISRSDKKDAEAAARVAQEVCRQDRLRSDSTWQARFEQREIFWQAKLEDRTQQYINSLRGITDTVGIAVRGIKKAVNERDLTSNEVNRKVNRNGRELDDLKTKAERRIQ